jgi:hypothetical protein
MRARLVGGPRDGMVLEEGFYPGKRVLTPEGDWYELVSTESTESLLVYRFEEIGPQSGPGVAQGAARWRDFTGGELRALWDALTLDDGLRYGISADDQPDRQLAEGIAAEAARRGLTLPDLWAAE